jgi:hypothetical protein
MRMTPGILATPLSDDPAPPSGARASGADRPASVEAEPELDPDPAPEPELDPAPASEEPFAALASRPASEGPPEPPPAPEPELEPAPELDPGPLPESGAPGPPELELAPLEDPELEDPVLDGPVDPESEGSGLAPEPSGGAAEGEQAHAIAARTTQALDLLMRTLGLRRGLPGCPHGEMHVGQKHHGLRTAHMARRASVALVALVTHVLTLSCNFVCAGARALRQ